MAAEEAFEIDGVEYPVGSFVVPTCERYELMQFPDGADHVLSDLMRDASQIEDRSAILDVPVADGRLLLFATNPCYRWQNHGEFNMLFNAILHHNDMAGGGTTQ